MCAELVCLPFPGKSNHFIGVLVFPCSAYSRCGSWTFTRTFLAVARCSVSGITIETIQTDLAVKASSVVSTILKTKKLSRFWVTQYFSFIYQYRRTASSVSSVGKNAKKTAIQECEWDMRSRKLQAALASEDESRSQSRSQSRSHDHLFCSQSSFSISFTCTVRYKGWRWLRIHQSTCS